MARAEAVSQALVNRVISKNRIKTIGKGEEDPYIPNKTDENKYRNRRIEIELVKNKGVYLLFYKIIEVNINFSRSSMAAFIIFLVINCIQAQNIKFTIADEFDSLGVQYATVCYKTKSQYCTFSDSLGLATCIGFDDSLIITRTGYKSEVFTQRTL